MARQPVVKIDEISDPLLVHPCPPTSVALVVERTKTWHDRLAPDNRA